MAIDCLARDQFIDLLIRMIDQICKNSNGCTFAINGPWGYGKTFVLDRLEERLRGTIQPHGAGSPYYIFRYNCWQYDFYEEPAVAIVAALQDELRDQRNLFPEPSENIKALSQVAMELSKKFAKYFLNSIFTVDVMEYWEEFVEAKKDVKTKEQALHEYDHYFSFKSELDSIRKALNDLSEEKPIVLLIDELDRCVPAYAIKILERLHHIFSEQQNIVVLLAIDQSRLEHSIQTIYGIKDAESMSNYMKKFISFSLSLEAGELSESAFWEKYHDYLALFDGEDNDSNRMLSQLPGMLFKGMDIRTQEKIMERILLLHSLSCPQKARMSVLYFELIHQTLSYHCRLHPCPNLEEMVVNPEAAPLLKEALGENLYTFLVNLEQQAYSSTKLVRSSKRPSYTLKLLRTSELAYAFLWFAMIANAKQDHPDRTLPYQPHDYQLARTTLPDSIKLFVEFSERMEYW